MSDFEFYVGPVDDYISENVGEPSVSYSDDVYRDVFDNTRVSFENGGSFIIQIEDDDVGLRVGLKVENIRGFLEDLKEFDTEGAVGDSGYVFRGGYFESERSEDCSICDEEIGGSAHVSFTDSYNVCLDADEDVSRYFVFIHESCVSEFIGMIREFLSDEDDVVCYSL